MQTTHAHAGDDDAFDAFIDLIGRDTEVSVPDARFICRPALPAPQCGSLRCVAICVCASGVTWRDDDATDVDDDDDDDAAEGECATLRYPPAARRADGRARDAAEPLEVSLWDAIDELADYESDDEKHAEREEDETTPSPREPVLPPLRKRHLAHHASPAKRAGFGPSCARLLAQ